MLTAVVLPDSRLMHKAIRFSCVIIAEERLLKLFRPAAHLYKGNNLRSATKIFTTFKVLEFH